MPQSSTRLNCFPTTGPMLALLTDAQSQPATQRPRSSRGCCDVANGRRSSAVDRIDSPVISTRSRAGSTKAAAGVSPWRGLHWYVVEVRLKSDVDGGVKWILRGLYPSQWFELQRWVGGGHGRLVITRLGGDGCCEKTLIHSYRTRAIIHIKIHGRKTSTRTGGPASLHLGCGRTIGWRWRKRPWRA